MKTTSFGRLAILSLSVMALGFSCGSDSGKKSGSQNTAEEAAIAANSGTAVNPANSTAVNPANSTAVNPANSNDFAPPTLLEEPRVESASLIIRYTHVMDNVTFDCKVMFGGTEAQWTSCAVLGELRVDVSRSGQYDIYIRARKSNGAASRPLHVSRKISNDNNDDSSYFPKPGQDDCYDISQNKSGKGDCQGKGGKDPGQNPGQNPGQHDDGKGGKDRPDQNNPGQYHCDGEKDPCYPDQNNPEQRPYCDTTQGYCRPDQDDGKGDNQQNTGYCYNPKNEQYDRYCNGK